MSAPSERSLAAADRIAVEAQVAADVMPAQPSSDGSVALLREMLARAEAGDVVAVGICAVNADRTIGTVYHGGDQWAALVGAASVLANRILTLT